MTEFTSEVKVIPYDEKTVFATLSDLSNLEKAKGQIPEDKINEFELTADSVSFTANPFGRMTIYVVDKEPDHTIKFAADGLPVNANLWIELKPTSDGKSTEMQIVLRAELNPFIKSLASKPLQKGIGKMADILASIPFA